MSKIAVLELHICSEYWNISHKFFRTTPETYPVAFLQGDIFDTSFLSHDPLSTPPSAPTPPLQSLRSLTPLRLQISIIHTGLFFHLFPRPQQTELARLLLNLLSPRSGSMILGRQLGLPDEEERMDGVIITQGGRRTFPSSPTSWRNMWNGKEGVFAEGEVEFQSDLIKMPGATRWDVDPMGLYWLVWSIERV